MIERPNIFNSNISFISLVIFILVFFVLAISTMIRVSELEMTTVKIDRNDRQKVLYAFDSDENIYMNIHGNRNCPQVDVTIKRSMFGDYLYIYSPKNLSQDCKLQTITYVKNDIGL